MSNRGAKIAKLFHKLLDYANYSALALESGVSLTRLPVLRNAANLIHALPGLNINGPLRIVDVGAHCGEWSLACARLFPQGKVLSFEPVPEYCREAQRRANAFSNWKVVQVALGQRPETMLMQVRGQRSSLKPLAGSEFPHWVEGNSHLERTEPVLVDRLDNQLEAENFFPVDLLKIDAEGFEREVLLGAEETLGRTKLVLIEVRFHELFDGGALFSDAHHVLTDHKFMLMHLKPCDAQCLWADATYAKREA